MQTYDLMIIGGGINGAGIANDAAGRGLSVCLVEQNDLASGTSWTSTKLIHGGLRYLEQFEFRLVKEALKERDVLTRTAPHLIHPMQFVLPHQNKLRPKWLLSLGLFIYDFIAQSHALQKSGRVKLNLAPHASVLNQTFTDGFFYSDCTVDDSRLVVANIINAYNNGTHIHTYTTFKSAKRFERHWEVELHHGDKTIHCNANCLINAAGPWADKLLNRSIRIPNQDNIQLVKGSHIVIPRAHDGEYAYVLQNQDSRIIFVIPYEDNYTLIGTTDINFTGDPKKVDITEQEINYLCQTYNNYFRKTISKDNIIWHFSGVRALQKRDKTKASKLSRDYVLKLDASDKQAPLLSVFGGKITTYRKLAEHALEKLNGYFLYAKPAWTHDAYLPGGNLPEHNYEKFLNKIKQDFAWLPSELATRYARSYGSLAYKMLKNCSTLADLGQHFANGLYSREVEYLYQHEWAYYIDDILWRRSKLGINFPAEAKKQLTFWFNQLKSTKER